nr:hypothetical protein [Ferrovum sp.]
METVNINAPSGTQLTETAQRFLASANSLIIDSNEMYQAAADDLASVKKRKNDLEEQRTGIVKPLNEAVKKVNDLFRAPMEFLTQAEAVLKHRMIGYTTEQDRLKRIEEAKLRAEAEKRANEERTRLEAQRRADEERSRIEREKLEAAKTEALEAGNAVQAAKIEARVEGLAEELAIKADSIAEQVSMVSTAPVVPAFSTPTIKGVSARGIWKAEVTNKLALVQFVAANPQYLNLLEPATKELGSIAKALKDQARIDGVHIFIEMSLASRSA